MVYASVSFLADLSSFIGLFVGLIGLAVTTLTLYRVSTLKRYADTYRSRHLFAARAGSYISQLRRINKNIALLMQQQREIQSVLLLLTECEQVCKSINEKIDTSTLNDSPVHNWQLSSISELESFVSRMMEKHTSRHEVDDEDLLLFFAKVASLINEIEQVEKDRKAGI